MRFGIANQRLFATVTTDASCGAVNGWHDSFTPLGGMVPLVNIMLSEVIFGGVGAGMYGILIYIVLAVFIAGLMVGRTPEYLGKKIEAYDVKMAMLVVLVFPLIILTSRCDFRGQRFRHVASISNPVRMVLAEILYAFISGDGKQRLGIRWHHRQHALVQHRIGDSHIGRPLLHDHPDAGHRRQSRAKEDTCRHHWAHFPSRRRCSRSCLMSVILIVGALTFFPALSLGPILEHLLMNAGKTF